MENSFVDLNTIGANQHKYPANHPSAEATYPDYTLICDTNTFGSLGNKKDKNTYAHGYVDKTEPAGQPEPPKKPAIEYRCLDYLMAMRNTYL